ncbi:MAG: hypothetical protein L6R42_003008, partial [Xanthoria sp. 1 TBL-2021]
HRPRGTYEVPMTGLASTSSTNITAEPIAISSTGISPRASIKARQSNLGFPDLGHPFCYFGVKPIDVISSRNVEEAARYIYFEALEVPTPFKGHKRHFDIYWKDEKLNVQVCISSKAKKSKALEVGPVDVGSAMRKIYDACCQGKETCGGGYQTGMGLNSERINVVVRSAKRERCPE